MAFFLAMSKGTNSYIDLFKTQQIWDLFSNTGHITGPHITWGSPYNAGRMAALAVSQILFLILTLRSLNI